MTHSSTWPCSVMSILSPGSSSKRTGEMLNIWGCRTNGTGAFSCIESKTFFKSQLNLKVLTGARTWLTRDLVNDDELLSFCCICLRLREGGGGGSSGIQTRFWWRRPMLVRRKTRTHGCLQKLGPRLRLGDKYGSDLMVVPNPNPRTGMCRSGPSSMLITSRSVNLARKA